MVTTYEFLVSRIFADDDDVGYVTYQDYKELEAERDRLLVEIDILKDLLQQHQNYQTKQGDKP